MKFPAFSDFANLWVPLCPSGAVAADRPVSFTVAGERVVLFRDRDGGVRALLDRCPHRGVALSLGTVDEGVITCPFHGWRFDGYGRCLDVPWNPDARRDQLSACSVPVREAGRIVWLHTSPNPAGEPAVPPVLLREDVRVTAQTFLWQVHWTRVMENMLDAPHLPFVHAGTIGKHLRTRTTARMEMIWTPTPTGGDITTVRPGEPPKTNLRYVFPNAMEMIIDPGERVLRLLAVCTPAAAGETRLTIYTMRNFAKARVLDPIFARMNARIAAEDRAIVESSLPSEVPPAAEEKSVATDAPTLAFRKIWFTRIQGTRTAPSSSVPAS